MIAAFARALSFDTAAAGLSLARGCAAADAQSEFIPNAFLRIATAVRAGSFAPGIDKENLASGTCVAVLNPKLVGTVITPELQAAVDEAGKQLVAGTIAIPQQ